MKLSYERKKFILDLCLTLLLIALTVQFILAKILQVCIPFCLVLLVRFVFLSRNANRTLAGMRRELTVALRTDQPYQIDRKKVYINTLASFSPIYLIWTAIAFLLLLGGFYGYLALFVPTALVFFVFSRLLLDTWRELEMKLFGFWLMQLGCYLLTLLPMLLVALTL